LIVASNVDWRKTVTNFYVFILSLIEGVTEFLPISSTGHLIIASALMDLNNNAFVTQFNIIIQFGAILSVLVLYWRKFLTDRAFYIKLVFAFFPAAIIGLLIKNRIDEILQSVAIVAWALIIGGIVLIFLDNKKSKSYVDGKNLDDISLKDAAIIGFMQCLAFIPGVSRAAATIIGGRMMGLNQKTSTEFSFFLAVPTLAGAALIKTIKILPQIQVEQAQTLVVGILLSFVFALMAIKTFIAFVSKGAFRWFGVYRIILGLFVLYYFQN
jgi:undecaprenyl-diphosphatase